MNAAPPSPASPDVPGIAIGPVTDWLETHVAGAVGPFGFDVIAGGHSNLTYRVTGADGTRFVLRRPPLGHRRASESIVDTMAAIHAVDLRAVGLDDLGKHEEYIARQLKRWYGQWNSQKTRELPAVDQVHDELLRRIPAQGPATIVHGDYRLDNCMVSDDGTVVAVLDWEICTLGDPLADVGLLQVYWTGPNDAASAWTGSATTAPGFFDRVQLAERYAEVSGRDLSNLPFYVSFAYWKLACILEGVYARYVGGALGQRDPAELEPFKLQVEGAAAMALATLASS